MFISCLCAPSQLCDFIYITTNFEQRTYWQKGEAKEEEAKTEELKAEAEKEKKPETEEAKPETKAAEN